MTSVKMEGQCYHEGADGVDVSSRDRTTLTASVEEWCEIHKPNYHNQSRQQQSPHEQTRKHELTL